jgi:hypothetical protein
MTAADWAQTATLAILASFVVSLWRLLARLHLVPCQADDRQSRSKRGIARHPGTQTDIPF